MRARVVLPTPGGPQKIIEKRCFLLMATAKGLLAPTRWVWPKKSASDLGRRLVARGTCSILCYTILLMQSEKGRALHQEALDAQEQGDFLVALKLEDEAMVVYQTNN